MSKERIVTTSLEEALERMKRGGSRTDWTRVDAMTDEDIEARMRDDPDWADLVDFDWSNATIVYPHPKHAISIRLDDDVIKFFKATGKGYQTRINAVLRHFMHETLKNKKAG
jgi:uncharacterized protein (DUF4415 family)